MNATSTSFLQSFTTLAPTTMLEWGVLILVSLFGGKTLMNKLSRSDCRLKWGNMVLDLHSRFQTERVVETEDQNSDAGNETDVGEAAEEAVKEAVKEPVKEKKSRKPRRKPEQ